MLFAEVIDGERVGLLIVGMALALGLALVLARVASRRRAPQSVAGAGVSIGPDLSATAASMASPSAQSVYEPLPEPFEEEQPVAMLQQRWQPSAASTASVPTSFLNLVEPRAPTQQNRSRFALATTLLSLALVVMLVSGAVLFRHQLMDVLSGMEASYGTADSSGASFGQTNGGAENAAANVGAAAALVASAPTAASLPTPVSALPVSDAHGVQKHVKSNGLNLRAKPGVAQDVVVVLKQGDAVTVFTDASLIDGATWVKVRAGEYEGWVDQSLLE